MRNKLLSIALTSLSIVAASGHIALAGVACPSYEPVPIVSGAAIYKPGTNIPDEDAENKNKELHAKTDDFIAYLGKTADGRQSSEEELNCAYGELGRWAGAHALMQSSDIPGRVTRVWLTPAFEFTALKFKMRGIAITPEVKAWFSELAAAER